MLLTFLHSRGLRVPICSKVFPARILRLNERDLPAAQPTFDLLLPRDGSADAPKTFEPGQPRQPVPVREPGGLAAFMLGDAAQNVVGHAGIECSRFVRHDVDPK